MALIDDNQAKKVRRNPCEERTSVIVGIESLIERKVEVPMRVKAASCDQATWVGLAADERRKRVVRLITQHNAVGDEQHGLA